MKKIINILLVIVLITTFCACANDAESTLESTLEATLDPTLAPASTKAASLMINPDPSVTNIGSVSDTEMPLVMPTASAEATLEPTAAPTPSAASTETTPKPSSGATSKPSNGSETTPKPATSSTPKPVATPAPTAVPEAAPAPEPTPEPTPEEEYTYMSSSYSSAVRNGVNYKRVNNGEYSTDVEVSLDSGLCSKAKTHAMEMAQAEDIFHSGLGYAESVTMNASSNGETEGARAAVHAPSLLDPEVVRLGVGAVKAPDGTIYLCVMGAR